VAIRPIRALDGGHPFNEVVCDDVFVPDAMVLGEIGEGWRQGSAELAFERSGPERFLSTYPLVEHLVKVVRRDGSDCHHAAVGALLARLWTLRQMSLAVAENLAGGVAAQIPAALVKDLGTRFERGPRGGASRARRRAGRVVRRRRRPLARASDRGGEVQAARQVAAAALAAGEQDLWPLLVGT